MGKIRKLIDIKEDALKVLDAEAKKQKRSLKSLLEYTLEETARKLESPSEEYQAMMDDMLKKLEDGNLNLTPIDELRKKYGI